MSRFDIFTRKALKPTLSHHSLRLARTRPVLWEDANCAVCVLSLQCQEIKNAF
jgi:hypothetical protein